MERRKIGARYIATLSDNTFILAYFGLIKIGQPKKGEVLVVSGAAGGTGSAVVQIGKILGLKVIGEFTHLFCLKQE